MSAGYPAVTPALDSCLQVATPVVVLAFLVVGSSCALMIPVMLYIFQLQSSGWRWQYAALLGSMLASTDAVAIVATMKSSESPSCTALAEVCLAPQRWPQQQAPLPLAALLAGMQALQSQRVV